MSKLKIALMQLTPTNNKMKNLEIALNACHLVPSDTDIIVFPEMWSNGYDIYNRPYELWKEDALTEDDSFIKSFSKIAKKISCAILITFLEKESGNRYNSSILFDRFGSKKLKYRKFHTCDFSVEKYLSKGDDFNVTTLNTKHGDVIVGVMICYDREFPESARIMMLKGAEVILVPNACPMEINRLSQLRGRAYENMLAVVTVNYPSTVDDCNGHSSIFDGVAYVENLKGSRDTCIIEVGEDEGIYYGGIDLDMLRHYRNTEVHGNCYRRPDKYHLLIDQMKSDPFIR